MKILALILTVALCFGALTACGKDNGLPYEEGDTVDSVTILGEEEITMELGDELRLNIEASSTEGIVWESSTDAVLVVDGLLSAEECGRSMITVTLGTAMDIIYVNVVNPDGDGDSDGGSGNGALFP